MGHKHPDLRLQPGWHEAWRPTPEKAGETGNPPEAGNETATPAEAIDAALKTINADLKTRLLDAILGQTPTFFEQLVLDVIVAMGYGGSRIDAAQHLGKSNDEGVDGRINQDPHGLDQIVVQAKRYAPNRAI